MTVHFFKSGLRYLLAYLVVSVICAVLIVAGNDLIVNNAGFVSNVSEVILQIRYEQWLPVCAVPLLLTAFVYLFLVRVLPGRLPLFISGLISGGICLTLILLTGVCTFSAGWYEIKNLITFFMAGFSFAILVELKD
ncbi:MAG: hypothetical protein EOP49_21465 [Sphingobacteriales bacterium]|nr:MAG: hypothetical protein EOP49_21465 [Sphingobacteriales bacterium]